MQYHEREHFCKNTLAKKLLRIMQKKQTNLALSADVVHSEKLLGLAERLGPEICILKTHVDILDDFSHEFIIALQKTAAKHEFLIFEDRKFADIGSTIQHQYQGGIYRIADWADMVNAHCLPGPGIIQGLAEIGVPKNKALLLVAEMSSKGNLLDKHYIANTINFAEKFPEFVIGFIAQHKINDSPQWIYMTPGVRFTESKDNLGQQYITPEKAIIENGTDIIIVGRGIINAADPLSAAQKYRKAGWEAYLRNHCE